MMEFGCRELGGAPALPVRPVTAGAMVSKACRSFGDVGWRGIWVGFTACLRVKARRSGEDRGNQQQRRRDETAHQPRGPAMAARAHSSLPCHGSNWKITQRTPDWAHATEIGGLVFHLPRVKSGKSTGLLPLATDCSVSGEITLEVTES